MNSHLLSEHLKRQVATAAVFSTRPTCEPRPLRVDCGCAPGCGEAVGVADMVRVDSRRPPSRESAADGRATETRPHNADRKSKALQAIDRDPSCDEDTRLDARFSMLKT